MATAVWDERVGTGWRQGSRDTCLADCQCHNCHKHTLCNSQVHSSSAHETGWATPLRCLLTGAVLFTAPLLHHTWSHVAHSQKILNFSKPSNCSKTWTSESHLTSYINILQLTWAKTKHYCCYYPSLAYSKGTTEIIFNKNCKKDTLHTVCISIPCESNKKHNTLLLPITSPNTDQFLKFFHQQTHQWLCNKRIIKAPTAS